jgi:hypothetical protein
MPDLPPTAAPNHPGGVALHPAPAPGAQRTAGAPAATSREAAEFGGPPGPEPTRYGDWEKNGRCIDF